MLHQKLRIVNKLTIDCVAWPCFMSNGGREQRVREALGLPERGVRTGTSFDWGCYALLAWRVTGLPSRRGSWRGCVGRRNRTASRPACPARCRTHASHRRLHPARAASVSAATGAGVSSRAPSPSVPRTPTARWCRRRLAPSRRRSARSGTGRHRRLRE